jgi:hypothetical protein
MTLPPLSDAEEIGEDIANIIIKFKEKKGYFKYVQLSISVFIIYLFFYLMTRQSTL